jgi:hypothetical protein
MKIATVTLRHKKKNKTIMVDQQEYSEDLGKHKYREYELVSAQHNDDESAKLKVTTNNFNLEDFIIGRNEEKRTVTISLKNNSLLTEQQVQQVMDSINEALNENEIKFTLFNNNETLENEVHDLMNKESEGAGTQGSEATGGGIEGVGSLETPNENTEVDEEKPAATSKPAKKKTAKKKTAKKK